jgi:hypothetical protein
MMKNTILMRVMSIMGTMKAQMNLVFGFRKQLYRIKRQKYTLTLMQLIYFADMHRLNTIIAESRQCYLAPPPEKGQQLINDSPSPLTYKIGL